MMPTPTSTSSRSICSLLQFGQFFMGTLYHKITGCKQKDHQKLASAGLIKHSSCRLVRTAFSYSQWLLLVLSPGLHKANQAYALLLLPRLSTAQRYTGILTNAELLRKTAAEALDKKRLSIQRWF